MRKENEVMSMLRVYVRKGIISKADFEEICGKKY